MRYTDATLNILTALEFSGVGRAWVVKNLSRDLSDVQIVDLLSKDDKIKGLKTIESFRAKREEVKKSLDRSQADGAIAWTEEGFPQTYAQEGKCKGTDIPVVVFYKGDITLLQEPERAPVAVIGLLEPTDAIVAAERLVVRELVSRGVSILSGLALGCDSVAHQETLLLNGKTIAVLPSTIDEIVPKENRSLANDILSAGGLLITEYYQPPQSRMAQVSRYVDRDRLQALFSRAVLLSASYDINQKGLDSGSRHAMTKAQIYGIRRAVIYNPELHRHDEMYDLNRNIYEADKSREVVALTGQNYKEEVLRLLKPLITCKSAGTLF